MTAIFMQIGPTAEAVACTPLNVKCHGKLTIKYYRNSIRKYNQVVSLNLIKYTLLTNPYNVNNARSTQYKENGRVPKDL